MKNVFSLFLAMIMFGIGAQAAETANSILDKTAAKINSAKSVTADYTISAGQSNEKGRLVISGSKFTLTSASLRTWFDGLTLWTYSPSLGEVNITSPTPSELSDINPFVIIENRQNAFNSKLLSSDNSSYKLELTPKNKGYTFAKVTLTIDKKTYYPRHIILTMSDRSTVTIKVESVTAGSYLSNDYFRFHTQDAPNAEIVDLR